MRQFRLLKPEEIECRVQRTTENGVQLLLYKTARTDYALLDEVVGYENWQNSYKEVDGKVYCAIGIKFCGEWIWKENCGAESNMEAEKGEASDAMKRAGFAWGIGTELYSSPYIWIPADRCKIENGRCNDRFRVSHIEYDESERISALMIDNVSKRCSAFQFGGLTRTDAELLRKQILELARVKGIEESLVTGATYNNGKTWDELTESDLAAVKVGMVKK